MSKFTFICEDDPMPFADAIVTKKTFEFNAEHLGSVIGEFESFLRGCGFNFEGTLSIFSEEELCPPSGCISEENDLDDLDSIFSGRKSLIRADDC
jgi:hypothetical protein